MCTQLTVYGCGNNFKLEIMLWKFQNSGISYTHFDLLFTVKMISVLIYIPEQHTHLPLAMTNVTIYATKIYTNKITEQNCEIQFLDSLLTDNIFHVIGRHE